MSTTTVRPVDAEAVTPTNHTSRVTSGVRPRATSQQVPSSADAPDGAGQTRRRPRLAILDGLRLVAALMVVSYHYISRADAWGRGGRHGFPTIVDSAAHYGFFGVELFFLISGFVICMSAMGRGLGEFFVARVVRLYPAYWFAILLTTAVLLVDQSRAHALS